MVGGVLHIENTLLRAGLGGSIRFGLMKRLSMEPYINAGMAYWAPNEIIASFAEGGVTTKWEVFDEIAIFVDALQTIPLHERLSDMPQSNFRFGISLNR